MDLYPATGYVFVSRDRASQPGKQQGSEGLLAVLSVDRSIAVLSALSAGVGGWLIGPLLVRLRLRCLAQPPPGLRSSFCSLAWRGVVWRGVLRAPVSLLCRQGLLPLCSKQSTKQLLSPCLSAPGVVSIVGFWGEGGGGRMGEKGFFREHGEGGRENDGSSVNDLGVVAWSLKCSLLCLLLKPLLFFFAPVLYSRQQYSMCVEYLCCECVCMYVCSRVLGGTTGASQLLFALQLN